VQTLAESRFESRQDNETQYQPDKDTILYNNQDIREFIKVGNNF